MTTFYNYAANYSNINGDITINLSLTVVGSLITITSGNIYAAGIFRSTSDISILSTNTYRNNDNILSNTLISPYFTTNGFAFIDNTHSLSYNINNTGGSDFVTISNSTSFAIDPDSESLSEACLLYTTKILTKDGYKIISDLLLTDIIISENKEFRIKNILISDKGELPYRVPKIDNIGEYLYISSGHAIKIQNKFYLPEKLGLKKVTMEELIEEGINKLTYYHIELYCLEGENRRSNTLTANGYVVESYSSEVITC